MLEEIQQGRNKMAYRVYIIALLCVTLFVLPIQQVRRFFEYYNFYNNFLELLNKDSTTQIDITNLYSLFSRNPYVGTWKSSMKRSQFLKQQQGKIKIRTLFNHSEYFNNFDINVQIFDGDFREKKFYDIVINSGSVKVKQFYQKGKIMYQTDSPLISYYKQGQGFKFGSQKSLYINKIKIKLTTEYDEVTKKSGNLKLQFLIMSQYSINVIARDLSQYQQTLHDLLLSMLLLLQFLAQGYGIFKLSHDIITHRDCSTRYSKIGFTLSTSFDVCQAITLTFVGFLSTKKMAIFSLPTLIIWIIIVAIQLRVLTILFQQQFSENALKFSAKIYGFFCLICILSYLCNFNSFYFVFISSIAMFPQIYKNYMVGHKLKENMKYFLLYVLPRYSIIPYVRMYKYNIFSFQPNYSLSLVCFLILAVQVLLIILQINYGARSIVPKFLHPEQLKYFFNQTQSQDDNCSICLISLKQKSVMENNQFNQMKAIRGQQFCNNIVLTPCRHKFHIECLANSMKTKLQCPNCRTLLPPLDQYQ